MLKVCMRQQSDRPIFLFVAYVSIGFTMMRKQSIECDGHHRIIHSTVLVVFLFLQNVYGTLLMWSPHV